MATQHPTLTERMRSTTTAEHDKSDTVVNLKLALVLTSPRLYGEALSLFVPIFERIESILGRTDHPQLRKLLPLLVNLRRTPGFRADMAYYLPKDRRRELEASWHEKGSVCAEYLQRLDMLEIDDPIRIIAYVYHLYAGVLAGGQIIKATVRKAMGLSKQRHNEGVAAFCVPEGAYPKKVLKEMKRVINDEISVSEEEMIRIIDEGPEVFRLNGTLIGSVKGTAAWRMAADECFKRTVIPLAGVGIVLGAYWLMYGNA